MSLAVFPSSVRGLTYPVEKQSEFNTLIQSAPNLLETTVSLTRNPAWRWQLIYEFLFDDPNNLVSGLVSTDYRTLQGFALAQGGAGREFLFTDPKDCTVGPALIAGSPNPLAQLQLVDDGLGNYYSPIQRNFGGLFYEDVTDLNGSITVYADSVAKIVNVDFTIVGPGLALPGSSFMGLVIKWPSPAAWQSGHAYALDDIILDAIGHVQKATTAGTSGTDIPAFNDAGSTTPDGTGSLVWTDQGYNPGPTGPINAQFLFYFRVRFASDKHDFTQFLDQFWTVGGSESTTSTQLEIKSSRPVQI